MLRILPAVRSKALHLKQSHSAATIIKPSAKQGAKQTPLVPVALFAALVALGPGYYWFQKKEEKGFLAGIPYLPVVVIGSNDSAETAIKTILKDDPQSPVLQISAKKSSNLKPDDLEKAKGLVVIGKPVFKIWDDIQVVEYDGGMVRYGKCLISNDATGSAFGDVLPSFLKDYLSQKFGYAVPQASADSEFVANSHLEVDPSTNGIATNSQLLVKDNLYCAGSACSLYDKQLGRFRAFGKGHEVQSGHLAALNMLRKQPRVQDYDMKAVTTTEQIGDIKVQAVGLLNSNLHTVSVLNTREGQDLHKGSIYYIKDQKVVGVLLLNVDKAAEAQKIVERQQLVEDPAVLKSLISLD